MPPRVVLIPIEAELAAVLGAGPAAFLLRYRAHLGELAEYTAELVRQTIATRSHPRWGGYLALDEVTRAVVGTCAFKGAPREGAVEIAYHTFPGFERRGYATAMAARLLEIAWSAPEVARVIALTQPAQGPATRVAEKLGLRRVAELGEPEEEAEGAVWRWERRRPGRGPEAPSQPRPACPGPARPSGPPLRVRGRSGGP